MVVRTKPFEYEATFVKKDSPETYEISGTVYENTEDQAIAAIERMYEGATRGVLRSVKIERRWKDEACGSRTKFFPPVPVVQTPKFLFHEMKHVEEHYEFWELDVIPFTYKENDDER